MKPNYEKLTEVHGDTQELITPSGHRIIIRQQNGEDDDVLSNAKAVEDGSSSVKFISRIVVYNDITENGILNLDDTRNLKLSDKYFIMLASRIFSLGQIVKFEYQWGDLKEPTPYEEDLGLYIWGYHDPELPFPEVGDEGYYKYRIRPHKFGKETQRELKLSTGKQIRYNFMDGNGEKWLMELPLERQSVNAELFARKIELYLNKGWVPIQNFKSFTSLEMMEIRKDVEENDITTALVTELEHPTTGQILEYPLVGSPDFFYPREI